MSSDSEGFESAGEDIDDIETLELNVSCPPSTKTFDTKHETEKQGDVAIATVCQGSSSSEVKHTQSVASSVQVSKTNLQTGSKPEVKQQTSSSNQEVLLSESSSQKSLPSKYESKEQINSTKSKSDKESRVQEVKDESKGNVQGFDEDWPGDWGDGTSVEGWGGSTSMEGWEVEEEDGFEIPQKLGSNIKTIVVERPIVEEAGNETAETDKAVASSEVNKSESPAEAPKPSGWGGWGWGVTSLLSTATESVQTLTQQVTSVSSGITSAIGGGIEGLLDAPDPEELARMSLKEKTESEETQTSVVPPAGVPDLFGISNLLGGVSQLGSKVISGGLDTLENLGKKTMEVLQEGDPGLKKKRALLFQSEKPILSQILREAKERNESEEKENIEDESLRKVQYETLFDDFHGLVHLEALEMISRQCEIKVQNILSEAIDEDTCKDNKETLDSVKELCELPNDDDDDVMISPDELKSRLEGAMETLAVDVPFSKLLTVDFDNESCSSKSGIDIHEEAITKIAKFTAMSMEFLHRIAESLMISDLSSPSTGSEALTTITMAAKYRVSSIAEDYCTFLTKMDPTANSPLVTNIYLEASNSNNYLGNAFDLFVPVLQLGALT